uniref:MFAP1 domain-containing protein n=1 Tax=Macrostomum lignano TaxID=282301 RepID=A0A1I8GW26_9PLAT
LLGAAMSFRRNLANWRSRVPVLSTAGAVPVRTEKGEMYLEKVKVKRYQGEQLDRRPRASAASADDPFVRPRREPVAAGHPSARPAVSELTADPRDRRLQRLMAAAGSRAGRRRRRGAAADEDDDEDDSEAGDDDGSGYSDDSDEEELDRLERHRRYRGEAVADVGGYDHHHQQQQQQQRGSAAAGGGANEDDEEQLDEAELEHRRAMLRMRAKQREVEEELMARQEEGGAAGSGSSGAGSDGDEELTEEEYTSDEDEAQPRLKPVFVRRRDRVTVGQQGPAVPASASEAPTGGASAVASTETPSYVAEERRSTTLQLVRAEARQEAEEAKALAAAFDNVDSADEEDDEVAYEAWKLRELKRLKRDREEREARQREQEELQRLRNMTEEERLAEQRRRPKVIDNKADKGKYKYLQKYYHRGAFFLDGDNDLLRRDVTKPTLEDHFDKSVLPKVMQVKNFGRAGRTKYTHLVDQDTTGTDNPWAVDSAQAQRFHSVKGGGMRAVLQRPSAKRSGV